MSRRICVITGSRSDFGHLSSVMRAIDSHDDLTLQTVVTGQHLDARFGETWRDIEDEGFIIDGKVDLDLGDDTPLAAAKAVGHAVGRLSETLAVLKPDIVMVLGDRFEILGAAEAALMLNIPLAHIHGGEITEAAIDDAIRHAITKMARLHFCAAEPYAKRLRQMGEDPTHIHMVGAPGLDHLDTLKRLSREELAADLGIKLSSPLFVITHHPVTLQLDQGAAEISAVVDALSQFDVATMIFTGVNSDPGHAVVRDTLNTFAGEDETRRCVVNSLGYKRYLSLLAIADVVIGNSSSGLIEAPAIGVPTVNIGDRQKGRLRGPLVIDCAADSTFISAAVERALDPSFKVTADVDGSSYARGGAGAKIAGILAEISLDSLKQKTFYDLP
ncbi:MAG: UDP-N-acetylglucosamine 2-epimerase (hydrolyzing) [Alphaproteobacteria bacterium]|nr:UDP-N-acetylglucosamine 2-epimerase (hydrolyzing) [Alphaproteobacteria bacterium]